MPKLIAVVTGEVMGSIESNSSGAISFQYAPAWLDRPDAFPLSTSIPLAPQVYKQAAILPFLWNLLPENSEVLKLWGQRYGANANNAFSLLLKVGEDVPGAAQLVSEEVVEKYLGTGAPVIDWISTEEVERRIRILKSDQSAVRLSSDAGRVSLAGAQAKTALYWDGERWGVPSGRAPNSHILKPQIPNFAGLVENEHLCMSIAASLGLPTARSQVMELSEPVIVVTRYDRLPPLRRGGMMRRVHQEDFCQALNRMPARKYQEEGGPSIRDCVELLRRVSSEPATDVENFIKANMFNWFIGGVDAHAKNYSLLIGADGVRLAPLYDVSSQLEYQEQLGKNGNRLAMKVGEFYAMNRVGLREWKALAKSCKLDPEQVHAWLLAIGRALPGHVESSARQAISEGLSSERIRDLRDRLNAHIQERMTTVVTVTY